MKDQLETQKTLDIIVSRLLSIDTLLRDTMKQLDALERMVKQNQSEITQFKMMFGNGEL